MTTTATRTLRLAPEERGRQIFTLTVNGVESTYYVTQSPGLIQLRRYGSTNVYDLRMTPNGLTCDCPDATIRKHKCKHVSAVETLIRLGKLTLPEQPKAAPKYVPSPFNDFDDP